MLRRWIDESGVSRGISTSFRSSLSATEAARWMRLSIAPDAIVPRVPIEQGQITYASTFAEPLAYGAFQSFGSYTVTLPPPARSSRRVSVSSRESRALPYSSVASTSTPALDAQMPSSTSAPLSASTRRAAYGAPDAPVIPRKTRMGRLLRALGRVEEHGDLMKRLVAQRREFRHHGVPELRRIRNVRLQTLNALPFRAFRIERRSAEVAAAGPEVRVACGAPG